MPLLRAQIKILISFIGKIKLAFKTNRSSMLSLIVIFITAIFFRTYNYFNRIDLVADNSRDAQVSIYAADNFKFPQIGQFSSAGPFFYGPWYYWFLELSSFIPLGNFTLWYVSTVLSLVFVWLIYWVGKEISGNWVGLIAALFAAISPAEIINSFAIWNPSIIPLLVVLNLVFLIRFIQNKKNSDIFLLGFLTGLAITIHFQSLLITPIVLVALFFSRPSAKAVTFLFFGTFIPVIPILVFDMRFNWYNIRSLYIYLTIDQFNIWVPNRWLTYAGTYWPNTWSLIVGGNKWISILLISLLSVLTLVKLKKFKNHKLYYAVAVSFILEIILYRYYRGERFFYYSFYSHPSIILLSAWAVYQIYKFKNYLGVSLFLIIVLATLPYSLKQLKSADVSYSDIARLKYEIYAAYPSSNFDIYGCYLNGQRASYPTALLIYLDGRSSEQGQMIGVCENENGLSWIEIKKDDTLGEYSWYRRTTSQVYRETVEWWKENPPNNF